MATRVAIEHSSHTHMGLERVLTEIHAHVFHIARLSPVSPNYGFAVAIRYNTGAKRAMGHVHDFN